LSYPGLTRGNHLERGITDLQVRKKIVGKIGNEGSRYTNPLQPERKGTREKGGGKAAMPHFQEFKDKKKERRQQQQRGGERK